MLPSEAARLMEISLGKLANIRSQRVSSSLHKNLLVAKVLNQVRTIVTVDDNLDIVHCVDHDKSALNVNCTNLSLDNSTPEHNSSTAISEHNSSTAMSEHNPSTAMSEHNPSTAMSEHNPSTVMSEHKGERCTFFVQDEEVVVQTVECPLRNDCVPSSDSVFETEPSSALCSSSKPNMVFVERDCASSSVLVDSGCGNSQTCRGSKRRRRDSECDQLIKKRRQQRSPVDESSWRTPSPTVSDVEDDMSVDSEYGDASPGMSYGDTVMIETEQISSLVTVFNTSFKGLGHLEGSVDDQVLKTRLSDTDYSSDSEQRFANLSSGSSLRRGNSLPDLCGKQADLLCQKFQKNPPVVALTV